MTRLRLKMSESQWKYRDWKCLNLNDETDTENVWAFMTSQMPSLKRSESQWWDQHRKCLSLNDDTKTKTEKVWAPMQNHGRGWNRLSLNDEHNTKNVYVSVMRPRMKMSESQWRDWKCLSLRWCRCRCRWTVIITNKHITMSTPDRSRACYHWLWSLMNTHWDTRYQD